MDELELLAHRVAQGCNHRDVEAVLRERGWTDCGAGDWAIALRSPSSERAARVSPFDPAYPYAVELYRRGADNPYLPRLDLYAELEGGGSLLVMEHLWPADPVQAEALREQIRSGQEGDVDLGIALACVEAVHARALRELRWCGPLDLNPGNFMCDARGQLKLIDLFYMRGLELYSRVESAPSEVLETFPPERRRYMFEIPYLLRDAPPGRAQEMHDALSAAERGLPSKEPRRRDR